MAADVTADGFVIEIAISCVGNTARVLKELLKGNSLEIGISVELGGQIRTDGVIELVYRINRFQQLEGGRSSNCLAQTGGAELDDGGDLASGRISRDARLAICALGDPMILVGHAECVSHRVIF